MAKTKLDQRQQQQLNSAGFLFLGAATGGPRKQKYYTPDGRVIFAIPGLREYVVKDDKGNVIETGIRDANLDKGWLLQQLGSLKLYCRFCNKWHDDEKGIKACKARTVKLQRTWAAKAKAQVGNEVTGNNGELKRLQDEVSELKEMISKLTKGTHSGEVL